MQPSTASSNRRIILEDTIYSNPVELQRGPYNTDPYWTPVPPCPRVVSPRKSRAGAVPPRKRREQHR